MSELERPLASPAVEPTARRAFVHKLAVVFGVLFLLAIVISRVDFNRDRHRLDAGMLSGSKEGNYFAIVAELSQVAAKGSGKLRNVESAGSDANITRLAASAKSCEVAFGLVQDGADFRGVDDKLELIARLPKSESVYFLGKDADKRTSFASLAKAKIGIGPDGSGTARLAKQIFALPDFADLGVELSNHPLAEQLRMAEEGALDLAFFVMDEDAPFIVQAMRSGKVQMATFSAIDVVARRLPQVRTGRIGAGQYDAVKVLPPEDKKVLRVDTLVVGNRCAGRSATIDLLDVLRDKFPDVVRHNKETPNKTGLPLGHTSHGYFEHGGPEIADEYVPWLVDFMAPANWAYIIMGVSILFNAMNTAHRFRLWRIDAARVKLEDELSRLFGNGATLGDIQRTEVSKPFLEPEARTKIDALIRRFEELAARSRRQSLSMLVPMGQEMAYRYQEGILYQTIAVLRAFRARLDPHAKPT